MNNFQGFDDQQNGSGIVGFLAGSLAGIGMYLGCEWAWWRTGWDTDAISGRIKTIGHIPTKNCNSCGNQRAVTWKPEGGRS